MPKKFMNTEAEQFLGSVNQIIEKGMIKSKDALISGLVPSNVPDTAVLGQFKVGGIHKYVFQKMNGQNFFEVKCHKIQKDAKGGKACNSSNFPTAQLYVVKDLKGKPIHYVVWDYIHERTFFVNKYAMNRANNLSKAFHRLVCDIDQFSREYFCSKLEELSEEALKELYQLSYMFEVMFVWNRDSDDKRMWDKNANSKVINLEKSKKDFEYKLKVLSKRIFVAEQLRNWSHIPIKEWDSTDS